MKNPDKVNIVVGNYDQETWTLTASPDKDKTKLQLSSDTYIYDARITTGDFLKLSEKVQL